MKDTINLYECDVSEHNSISGNARTFTRLPSLLGYLLFVLTSHHPQFSAVHLGK
jgi:hypothetical protein